MIKGFLSGSAYLTAPLLAGCCEAIRRGGEKVKLTFKRKWCTLIAPCCLFHHWFSHFFMTLTLQSPNAFHLIEQTQLTRAVITALMIPIYFSFNEQTVGMKKTRKIKSPVNDSSMQRVMLKTLVEDGRRILISV